VDARSPLVEGNVAAFLLEMGRVGGGEERRDREVAWTVGGSPLGYHNAVVHCDAGGSRAEALIDEWVAALEERGLPGSWHVTPAMRPADLVRRLQDRGFEHGGDEPAMVCDLSADTPPVAPVTGLAVEPVRAADDLEAYRSVLADGFGEGPPEAAWVAGVFGRIGLGRRGPWHHWVGRVGGRAVATATLLVAPEDVAGVYFVATVPAERRRGIGAAVTRHALVEARSLGCRTAVLGSSPMGAGVYRRLGFEEVFRYRLLEWSPPSQRTTSSTRPESTS
jgi:ribosomal protein S18 acetylase RimI-like enzyme